MGQALDTHGPSWRDWVLHNLGQGCQPRTLLGLMLKGPWAPDHACAALDQGLAELGRPVDWRPALPYLDAGEQLRVGEQTIGVLSRLNSPRAALLDHVLTVEECDALVELATAKGLKRSGLVDAQTGDSVVGDARTSTSVCFQRGEHPLVAAIETRLAQLTHWPADRAEGLQVLCYQPGQQYKPHYDWFNPSNPGSALQLKRGGQRVATTVMYLSRAEAGGGTRFPKVGAEMAPRQGGAVFFVDLDPLGQPDDMTLHSGVPVERGTKIVATYWQREGVFI